MWKAAEYTEVSVGERKGEADPDNITKYLIDGSWWAPRLGKPWMKQCNHTCPTVSVNATVERNDLGVTAVLVYVSLTGSTAKGAFVEFGGSGFFIMDTGDVWTGFIGNISDFEVQPGNYSFWITCYALGYVNVHPNATYYLGYA